MASERLGKILRYLRRVGALREPEGPSDGQLLRRFASGRDEAAFEALLERHGAMVLGVCHRLLGNADDADDAFQATFCVLVRKAGSIDKHESLASWLYGVALRTALRARALRASRKEHEQRAVPMKPTEPTPGATWDDVRPVLDEEIDRLPEKYRAPVLLCYLRGRTYDEAAAALGCPKGTVATRLHKARVLLRERLRRRGVTLSAGGLAAILSAHAAPAAVPRVLTLSTLRAAALTAAGGAGLSAGVSTLVEGVLKVMSAIKTKTVAAFLLLLGAAGTGAGLLGYHVLAAQPEEAARSTERTEGAPAPAMDRHGDPLPPGAVARLGTIRFRHGHTGRTIRYAGDTIATTSWDGTLRLWDAATGKERHRFPIRDYTCAAVSADGRFAASVGGDNVLRLFDVAEKGEAHKAEGFIGKIGSLTLSPDGATLAFRDDRGAHLWDVAAWREVRLLPEGGEPHAFSPDGRKLLTLHPPPRPPARVPPVNPQPAPVGKWDVTLWDIATGREVRRWQQAMDLAYQAAFSPDGKWIACGGRLGDGTVVILWDAATGEERLRLSGPPGWVRPVSFSPDGKTLAVGGPDATVRLFDAAAGREKRTCRLPAPERTWVMGVAFSPDGKTVASTGEGRAVRLWDVATGAERDLYPGHADSVSDLHFALSGGSLLSAGGGTVIVWDPHTGKELRCLSGPEGTGGAVAVTPDGRGLLTDSGDGTVRLRDLASGRELRRFRGPAGSAGSLALSPDGNTLAAGAWPDHAIRLYDVPSGEEKLEITLPGPFQRPQSTIPLAFAADGRVLVSGSGDHLADRLHVWDTATGKELRRFEPGGAIALPPDGELLAVASGNTVRLIDVSTGRQRGSLALGEKEQNRWIRLGFSADGRLLAAAEGSEKPAVRVWEVTSGALVAKFPGHAPVVHGGAATTALAFSPDGRTLVTGGDDTTILLWDLTGGSDLPRSGPARLSPEDLDARWADLAGADAQRARRAVWSLAADPPASVPFLDRHLRDVRPAPPELIRRLIGDLGSERFAVRDAAARKLLLLGDAALPHLRDAGDDPSAEVRKHAERLSAEIEAGRSPQRLRLLRALEVLEHARTPEARQALERFAREAPQGPLTRQAELALRRLPHGAE